MAVLRCSFSRAIVLSRSSNKAAARFFSSSLVSFSLRTNTRVPNTLPLVPGGTRREASTTSSAFLPKITFKRRSSGVSCCSPLGVTLPTKISPGSTTVAGKTIPSLSKWDRASVPMLGISRVISSAPSFVLRASTVNSCKCTEVNTSSLIKRLDTKIASS